MGWSEGDPAERGDDASSSSASSPGASILSGWSVLVAEDEMFIATDIASAVEEAGGKVVGPFATLHDVQAALSEQAPQAAILDVNLLDGDIDPAIPRLRDGGVRIVINTGAGREHELVERYPGASVFMKPTDPDILVAALVARDDRHRKSLG